MRSREEQIINLGAALYAGRNNLTDANCEAQHHIDEAIQRGRELEHAERGNGHDSDCATHNEPALPNGPCNCTKRDTERVDWLEKQVATELSRFDEGWVLNTDLTCQAHDQATARTAIDRAMRAEQG